MAQSPSTPLTLGYLMRVAGPAHLPNGIAVTANNVAGLTQSRQYTLYPGFGVRPDRRAQAVSCVDRAGGVGPLVEESARRPTC